MSARSWSSASASSRPWTTRFSAAFPWHLAHPVTYVTSMSNRRWIANADISGSAGRRHQSWWTCAVRSAERGIGNLGFVKAGAALVLIADPAEAGRRVVGEARALLGGLSPSFAVMFASAHFLGSAEALAAAVAEQTGPLPLIGCVAQAVVGGAREIESGPAVSLWLAAGVGPVETFAMEFVRTPSGGAYGGYPVEPGGAGAFPKSFGTRTLPAPVPASPPHKRQP